jgi:hypothetical protein
MEKVVLVEIIFDGFRYADQIYFVGRPRQHSHAPFLLRFLSSGSRLRVQAYCRHGSSELTTAPPWPRERGRGGIRGRCAACSACAAPRKRYHGHGVVTAPRLYFVQVFGAPCWLIGWRRRCLSAPLTSSLAPIIAAASAGSLASVGGACLRLTSSLAPISSAPSEAPVATNQNLFFSPGARRVESSSDSCRSTKFCQVPCVPSSQAKTRASIAPTVTVATAGSTTL